MTKKYTPNNEIDYEYELFFPKKPSTTEILGEFIDRYDPDAQAVTLVLDEWESSQTKPKYTKNE